MLNDKQCEIVAEYLGLTFDQIKACDEVVELGVTKYAAEKKHNLTPNTLVRHVVRFDKVLTMMLAMAAADEAE